MRTLTATLQAAQEGKVRRPAPKIVLTSGATSYTYENDRIIRVEHAEHENTHQTIVVLSNADGALTDLDLKGYDAVLYHGLTGTAGKEYSACPPLKVVGQKFDSYPGGLACTLQLIGIPDRLMADKASADYEHHWSSPKTVKDLINEILDGQPVADEYTEKQESGTSQESCNAITWGVGQRRDISGEKITKISFKLKKIGNPTGNITYRVVDVDTESDLVVKVMGDASTLTIDFAFYEVTLVTPLEYEGEVYMWCQFQNGDGSNQVVVKKSTQDVKANEHYVQIYADSSYVPSYDMDCVYHYKYEAAGISVYSHCQAYEVVYDSEDALIDTYKPADSFRIKQGEDRLTVIDKLLYHTNCQRRFENDGKIHVFVPTTTGTTYDSEYSLPSGHPFFSKSLRKGLVIPNQIVVESNPDDETQYSGNATSAASYALLPVSDFYRTVLESNAQGASLAAAIISRLEIAAQQGGAGVPVNCGTEIYDYIKVTDPRQGDYRVGNVGSIDITYQAERGSSPARYDMTFNFGRVSLKGVAGTRVSSLLKTRFIKRNTGAVDTSIPWDELYSFLQEMADNLHDVNVALGWAESQTPADEVVESALLGYIKNVVEDPSPQLGADLDVNDYKITGVDINIEASDDININAIDNLFITAEDFQVQASDSLWLDAVGVMTFSATGGLQIDAEIVMNSQKITFLADPTSDQDAATKKYVDDNAGGVGDMTKAVYDTDADNVVESADNADTVDGSHASAFATASHAHAAADITSGTLDGNRLPAMSATKKGGVPATGTPSGKYLKDDGAWGDPAGTGMENIVEDLTPQLGGDLDTNGFQINIYKASSLRGFLKSIDTTYHIELSSVADLYLEAGVNAYLEAVGKIIIDCDDYMTLETAAGYGISIKAGGAPTTPAANDLILEAADNIILTAVDDINLTGSGINLDPGSTDETTIKRLSSTQHEVTGSRATGTVYQNTSGYLILVNIVVVVAQGTDSEVYAENGDSSPDVLVSQQGNEGSSDDERTHVFLVNPGGYYQLASSGVASISSWIETYIGE